MAANPIPEDRAPTVVEAPSAPPATLEPEILMLGKAMAASGFFKDLRSASQAMVKILAGREMGFGPVASCMNIYIVDGKVTLGGNLIAAAIKRSPHYSYRIRTHTDQECTLAFFEHGEEIGVSTFTIRDAQQAGLAGKAVWKNYPRNMLFNRAISNGARWYCPDLFGGSSVYTPEELGQDATEASPERPAAVAPTPITEAPQQPAQAQDAAPANPATPMQIQAIQKCCAARGVTPPSEAELAQLDQRTAGELLRTIQRSPVTPTEPKPDDTMDLDDEPEAF